eukprot:Phypoly_transcript_08532.p1 GENE.Phypoly_transcript_08532~~Phypoly_transcript_08532.p1  ORF type:complete len:490 (+),score=110.25 Phypoly_transcript_08532:210-1472(+)
MKKAESGKIQKEIGQRAKEKKPFDDLKQRRTEIEEEVKAAEPELERLEKELHQKLNRLGNIVHASVKVSKDEDENEIVKVWPQEEQKKREDFKHHYEILEKLDGYDTERGVKVAGNRGYFLKGVGLLLNQALIAYGMQFLSARSYTPLQTPFFMNKDVMSATAQLEDFDEQLYKVAGSSRTSAEPAAPAANPKDKAAQEKAAQEKAAHQSDMEEKYLIATSEQPISAMHKDEYLDEDELPIRYAGYSMCFRKEAGQMRDARGIFRVHQFEKVEQFVITHPEKSWEMHEEMIKSSEEFYQSLGIPYRVVVIVSGALNNAAAKKYDLEGYFPAFGGYRELVSCSNCTDYQSRSLNVKMRGKKEDKEHKFVHMLNSTLCATTRTICAIVENHQTPDGVNVPAVLQPFLGGRTFLPFVEKKKKH